MRKYFVANMNVEKEAKGVYGKFPRTHPPLHCMMKSLNGLAFEKKKFKL
jgi:hypothetical protein